ncbi:iron ABC transporter ATP-binding protein [Neisseria sp. Ec49-e6-T10]|uniref:iron ABC transporter ATP-binding protein n=1 Tax=Neisseria sp. Ec49-e6-T10 TaxID=3140744 RepID=UPI003EBC0359
MIEVHNVTKHYGQTVILDDVSVVIPKGGITSIIGPNGAGKSTLLSSMGRLLPLEKGKICVNGLDITQTNSNILARSLSILRQENQFTSRLTIRELVGFGRYPYTKGRLNKQDHEKIDMALSFLNLTPLQNRFLDELSGGQRQRAYVAMVLCQDTDYVLLDEPLNNLDMKHSVAMMKQIRRAADELGKTIVLVVHDINFASAYSDKIVAMRQGKIIYNGTPDELMKSDILEDIFDTPVKVEEIKGQQIGVYYR